MSSDYRHKYGYGGARRAPAPFGEEPPKPVPPPTPVPVAAAPPRPEKPIVVTPRRNVHAPPVVPTKTLVAQPSPVVSQRKVPWKRLKLPATLLLIAFLAVGVIYMVARDNSLESAPGDMIAQVVSELSIQNDSNPAVLGVVDKEKVNQPFLDDAKNGDKVLLFYKAKLSVLYRPNERRIVKSGSFTPPAAKVFLRDGASDKANLEAVKEKLKDFKDINITSQDQSAISNYSGIRIVHITGRYEATVKALADQLGATTMSLPTGETAPDADILLIVGK